MTLTIDIRSCCNCLFHDEEWGCTLIQNHLVKECPWEGENIVIIKNEGEGK